MNRSLIAAVSCAVVAALAGPAAAATPWKATVLAKDASRQAVVAASPSGTVRTVRVSKARFTSLRVGRRITVVGARLADGTFRAKSLRVQGDARRATLRGVVVRDQPKRGRTLVSAGGSVFPIARGKATRTTSARQGLAAGEAIVASLAFSSRGHGPRALRLRNVGRVSTVEIEGIFVGLSGSSLNLAVARHGLLGVGVPDGAVLPALRPGDVIELVATIAADGSFTLLALDADDADDHGLEADEAEDEIEVAGTVSSLHPLTVAPERGLAVSCTLPPGLSLVGVAVGDRVEVTCDRVGDSWVLRKLEIEDSEDEVEGGKAEDEVEVEGRLTSLDPVTVEPAGGTAVSCALPAGMMLAGFAVGDAVEMECELVAGAFVVTELEVEDDEDDEDDEEDEEDEEDDEDDEEDEDEDD